MINYKQSLLLRSKKGFSEILIILIVAVLVGVVGIFIYKNQDHENKYSYSNTNINNGSASDVCLFDTEYNEKESCSCEGRWDTYPTSDGLHCRYGSEDKIYICRDGKGDFVPGIILIGFNEGTTFEEAVTVIEQSNAEIVDYICDWNPKLHTTLMVPVGQEENIIEQLLENDIVRYAELNTIIKIHDKL